MCFYLVLERSTSEGTELCILCMGNMNHSGSTKPSKSECKTQECVCTKNAQRLKLRELVTLIFSTL